MPAGMHGRCQRVGRADSVEPCFLVDFVFDELICTGDFDFFHVWVVVRFVSGMDRF
jgi:hypothetical protein